jgi:Zn-dependent M28 family amino/carboxypeptidase
VAGQAIVIGAHYDHIGMGGDGRVFPGAADNASGTAVVLEAARAFATCGQKPKRTVVFALWCGEEQGLYGSKHYVEKDPVVPLDSTRLMIQVDYLDDQNGPCISNVTDDEMVQRFIGAAVKENRVIVLDTKGQCASDDCSFLERKIPACRFIAQGEHHHKDVDTAANLSRQMLKETADLVIEGIRNTAF